METITIDSIEELSKVARWLDEQIKNSDARVVALYGAMGAGKTTLISCFANLHGSRQTPSSPTFAIINTYDAKDVTIYHFDLYRVDDRREVEDLALEEYFYADNAISLVEWPEKIEAFLPQELTLRIKIDVLADNVRKFSVIN